MTGRSCSPIAYDEGKLIGVLEGSGGITAPLPDLVASFGKPTGATVIGRSPAA